MTLIQESPEEIKSSLAFNEHAIKAFIDNFGDGYKISMAPCQGSCKRTFIAIPLPSKRYLRPLLFSVLDRGAVERTLIDLKDTKTGDALHALFKREGISCPDVLGRMKYRPKGTYLSYEMSIFELVENPVFKNQLNNGEIEKVGYELGKMHTLSEKKDNTEHNVDARTKNAIAETERDLNIARKAMAFPFFIRPDSFIDVKLRYAHINISPKIWGPELDFPSGMCRKDVHLDNILWIKDTDGQGEKPVFIDFDLAGERAYVMEAMESCSMLTSDIKYYEERRYKCYEPREEVKAAISFIKGYAKARKLSPVEKNVLFLDLKARTLKHINKLDKIRKKNILDADEMIAEAREALGLPGPENKSNYTAKLFKRAMRAVMEKVIG